MAFIKTLTIKELLLKTILTTVQNLEADGMIYQDPSRNSYKALTSEMKLFDLICNPRTIESMKIAILLNLKSNNPATEERIIEFLEKYEESIAKCPCEE